MTESAYVLEIEKGGIFLSRDSPLEEGKKIGITDLSSAQPFIKWAGGKRWLAQASRLLKPKDWNGTYYEPFIGGGSFYFSLAPENAIISDLNKELITAYRVVKRNPTKLINLLKDYRNESEFYYSMRSARPTDNIEIAARFIYLNRVCWNGLYRVNPKGEFNTPFGSYKNPTICDPERIKAASKTLQKTQIKRAYFADVFKNIKARDWVYFDPPYITGHQNNGFLEYNQNLFSWKDQIKLAEKAKECVEKGAHVLVSNADYPQVIELYKGFYCYRAKRRSLIGGQTSSRGFVTEAILSSYPLLDSPSTIIN